MNHGNTGSQKSWNRLSDLKKSGYVTADAIHSAVMDVLERDNLPDSSVLLRAFGFAQAMDDNDEAMLIRYTDLSQRCEVCEAAMIMHHRHNLFVLLRTITNCWRTNCTATPRSEGRRVGKE